MELKSCFGLAPSKYKTLIQKQINRGQVPVERFAATCCEAPGCIVKSPDPSHTRGDVCAEQCSHQIRSANERSEIRVCVAFVPGYRFAHSRYNTDNTHLLPSSPASEKAATPDLPRINHKAVTGKG